MSCRHPASVVSGKSPGVYPVTLSAVRRLRTHNLLPSCHVIRRRSSVWWLGVRGLLCHVMPSMAGGYGPPSVVRCHAVGFRWLVVLGPLIMSRCAMTYAGRTREPFGSLWPQTAVLSHSTANRDPPKSAHRSEISPLTLFFPVCEQLKKVGQPPFSTLNRKGSLAGWGYIIIFSTR